MKSNYIEVDSPSSFDYVGTKFTISGWINLSCFQRDMGGLDLRIFLEYLDLDGQTFMGSTGNPILDDTKMRGDLVSFRMNCEFHHSNIHFIQKSLGRVTLKLEGINTNIAPVYLPLVVKKFETDQTYADGVKDQHAKVGEIVEQYKRNLKEYYNEIEKLHESRKAKDGDIEYQHLYNDAATMGFDIYEILETEDVESFEKYTYSEEDRREEELKEKYKDALEWQGPLAEGIVSRFNGFELRVYSDDHDSHFHVIHKGKGIDARFSFPGLELMSYKSSQNTIGSKEEKKIQEYCRQPNIFKKFEEEFSKRES